VLRNLECIVFVTAYLRISLNVKALAVVILKSVVKNKKNVSATALEREKKILLGGNSIHI